MTIKQVFGVLRNSFALRDLLSAASYPVIAAVGFHKECQQFTKIPAEIVRSAGLPYASWKAARCRTTIA